MNKVTIISRLWDESGVFGGGGFFFLIYTVGQNSIGMGLLSWSRLGRE